MGAGLNDAEVQNGLLGYEMSGSSPSAMLDRMMAMVALRIIFSGSDPSNRLKL